MKADEKGIYIVCDDGRLFLDDIAAGAKGFFSSPMETYCHGGKDYKLEKFGRKDLWGFGWYYLPVDGLPEPTMRASKAADKEESPRQNSSAGQTAEAVSDLGNMVVNIIDLLRGFHN